MQRLSDAVAIQSVSGWTYPPYRDNIVRMINQVKDVCAKHSFLLYHVTSPMQAFV